MVTYESHSCKRQAPAIEKANHPILFNNSWYTHLKIICTLINNFIRLLFHSFSTPWIPPPTPESMLLGVKGRTEGLKYNNDFGGRGWGYTSVKRSHKYRSVSTLMSLIVAAQQSDYACRNCGNKGHFQIYFRTLE